MRPLLTLILVSAAMIGCSGGSASGSGAQTSTAPRRGSSNVISRSELASLNEGSSALEAIQRLRPTMLRTRGGGSILLAADPIHVFLNSNRLGDPESLGSVQASELQEIRFLSASEATQKWGTGYTNGAIQLTSRTR